MNVIDPTITQLGKEMAEGIIETVRPLWAIPEAPEAPPVPMNDAARIADLTLEVNALEAALRMTREMTIAFQNRMHRAEADVFYWKEKARLAMRRRAEGSEIKTE